ncbi:MAG: rhomboid family intramembrane serine protease [Parachlamydiaceae bacterium]|nr:rhomboid family intramembrane serine protease [Parachlamydiaceae bacterium]
MSYTLSQGWGPNTTSRTLTYIIGSIAVISIFSALLDGIFVYYLEMNGTQSFLSLSWKGLTNWYIWQPFSYLFVLPSGNGGLSLYFFIELLFDMYILWIMGSALLARAGAQAFCRFFFSTGVITGLLTLLWMPVLQQYSTLAGPTAPIIAIMMVWTMLHAESELLLFFLIPVKAKWLFLGLLGVFLLTDLSHLNFIHITFILQSVLIGYLYGTMIWGLKGPFTISSKIDNFFINFGNKLRSLSFMGKSDPMTSDKDTKILDFHNGTPYLDDDAFMDQALEKISKHGERSLTWSERSRMMKISEKKYPRK